MRCSYAISVVLVLAFAGAVTPVEKDTDRDGIPDSQDRRPSVASYYAHSAIPKQNPQGQSPTQDTDLDGIADQNDASPWVAEYYKHQGAPHVNLSDQAEGVDTDFDGVTDRNDNRPTVAEYYHTMGATVYSTPSHQQNRETDSDRDGVSDSKDVCPNTPIGAQVDSVGCPLDSDRDGVPDAQDKCPNTERGIKVDATGCPADSDKDGVLDSNDKCPNTPKGIPVDETGCPKIVKKGEKITLQIEYATNSYEPDTRSKEILDGIAQTMKDFPSIKIAVKGFTDNVGSDAHNQNLSDNRAKRVMEIITENGVAKGRLTAKGYGENPKYFVGDNATDEGRQKNRRVEIESVE